MPEALLPVSQAGLIICYAGTGRTASLVAKYRPNVPILTLVVPQLKSKGLAWELQGRSLARQFLIMRGAPRIPSHCSQVSAFQVHSMLGLHSTSCTGGICVARRRSASV